MAVLSWQLSSPFIGGSSREHALIGAVFLPNRPYSGIVLLQPNWIHLWLSAPDRVDLSSSHAFTSNSDDGVQCDHGPQQQAL